jgi:hypothetical protein
MTENYDMTTLDAWKDGSGRLFYAIKGRTGWTREPADALASRISRWMEAANDLLPLLDAVRKLDGTTNTTDPTASPPPVITPGEEDDFPSLPLPGKIGRIGETAKAASDALAAMAQK